MRPWKRLAQSVLEMAAVRVEAMQYKRVIQGLLPFSMPLQREVEVETSNSNMSMSYKDRLATCRSCEHYLKHRLPALTPVTPNLAFSLERCGQCGCPIIGRVMFASCPIGKFQVEPDV